MPEAIETFEECPVCGDLFGVDQLAAHCEAHFEDPSQVAAAQQPADAIACPVEGCQASIPAEDYEAHLFSHRCKWGFYTAGLLSTCLTLKVSLKLLGKVQYMMGFCPWTVNLF
jgi:hypothetical protein